MISHHEARKFDKTLKMLFDEVDDYLEEKFGALFSLHPNRPKKGETSNKSQDGLFDVGVKFTMGYGSQYGKGYVMDFRFATLERVPPGIEERVRKEIVQKITDLLPSYFPDRDLRIEEDGRNYKIVGDFSLGQA